MGTRDPQAPPVNPFIAKLIQARIDAGISQVAMGERLGVGNGSISRWEREENPFPLQLALRYIEEVGLEVGLRRKPLGSSDG